MILSPFLYYLFILLSLVMITLVAQRLKVALVKEPFLPADRPRYDMIHAGRRLYPSVPLALGAERVHCPVAPG